ncbi:hypothetical protein AWN76_007685 [Rhodothermaceae bacterium RA]|nr:hypothetical protein AWN76_007685 [Rhodothermaceae bacterium RA]
MNRSTQPIDEYTLAAFIAGTLSEERRREVIAYLAEHPEARTLLHMAVEAMDAATEPAAPTEPAPAADDDARDGADRSPLPRPTPTRRDHPARPRSRGRYLTLSLALVLAGIGIGILLTPPIDGTRTPHLAEDARLVVDVDQPELAFSWNAIPNAEVYRIVVWDPEGVRIVAEHETAETELDADSPFMRALRERLAAGHRYSLRVDALNAQRRQIQSSRPVDFTLARTD